MITLWVRASAADLSEEETDDFDPEDIRTMVVDKFVILDGGWVRAEMETGELRWFPDGTVVRIDAEPWDHYGLTDGNTVPDPERDRQRRQDVPDSG